MKTLPLLLIILAIIACVLAAPVQEDDDTSEIIPLERAQEHQSALDQANRAYEKSAKMIRLIDEKSSKKIFGRKTNCFPRRFVSNLINMAAKRRDWKVVQVMLAQGAEPQQVEYSMYRTALHGDAHDYNRLHDLLKKHMSSSALHALERMPHLPQLQETIQAEWNADCYNSATVEEMMEHFGLPDGYANASPEFIVLNGETTPEQIDEYLIFATLYGQTTVVKKLLSIGADVDYGVNPTGPGRKVTASIIAAYAEYSEIIQALNDAGADYNIRDNNGATALMYSMANVEITKTIFSDIVDKDAQDDDGNTAKEYFDSNVESALQHEDKYALLNLAVVFGSLESIRMVLDTVDNVNYYDEDGNTPLINAITTNSSEKVKLVIEKGADVNMKNKNGNTVPLSTAVIHQNYDIVKLLLDKRAKASARDKFWISSWDYAIMLKNEEILKLLWETKLFLIPKFLGHWMRKALINGPYIFYLKNLDEIKDYGQY